MKTFKARITKILMALLLLPAIAAAAPSQINYQGRLVDATGNPLSGSYTLTFRIYDAASAGTTLWTEPQTLTVDNGIFSAKLGSVANLPPSVFSADTRYLGVTIAGDAEMTPRVQLLSVPYAIYAASAASVGTSGQGVIISTFVQVNDYISATRFIGDGSGLTGISAGGSSVVLPIVSTHIADGSITAAKLNSNIMVEGENISLLTNNAGYITSADDTVSGTELDGVFSTTGLLRRTAANTYSTTADNSANWDTAFGWGNHGVAGYATAANLNTVIASTQPLVNYANWNTAFGWGNHGIAGYATAANLNSVIASTQPLVNYANWDAAAGWGNHAIAGYATAANLNSVIASTQPLVNYANWNTAFGWGNHGVAGYATAVNLNNVIASTQPLVNYANWDTAFGWGNHALGGYMASTARNAANGVAPLDAGSKIGITYLASCADTQILKFSGGAWTCATDNEGAGGTVTGSGLANKVAFWSAGAALSSTTMHWDGLNQRIGIGNASPAAPLDVAGDVLVSGSLGATAARLAKGWFADLEVTNTIIGSVSGNAATVTNGVYTNGAYPNPAWITSLATSKIDLSTVTARLGAVDAALSTGVYTSQTYNNPAWLNTLAATKLTGAISGTVVDFSTITARLGAVDAALSTGVYTSQTYANPAWITSLATSKIDLSTVTARLGAVDAALSTAAYTNVANTFSSKQTITASGAAVYSIETSSGIKIGAGSLVVVASSSTLAGNAIMVSTGGVPMMMQSGGGTLAAGTQAVSFTTAFAPGTIPIVVLTDTTAINAMRVSAVSNTGFTANGTATDTYNWIAIGAAPYAP